jgi:hypothetical protein
MHALEITIQRKSSDGWPVVVKQSTSEAFLPVGSKRVLHLDDVELRSQTTPKDYGTLLGRALFRDDVRDAFVRARRKRRPPAGPPLHRRSRAQDLALGTAVRSPGPRLGLPDPRPAGALLPLSARPDRRFPPIGRRDLRVLLVAANPEGLGRYSLLPFDVAPAVSSLRTALRAIPCDVLATVEGAVGRWAAWRSGWCESWACRRWWP